MSKSLKRILFAIGGLIGLLVLVAVAVRLFVDINAHKPRLEAVAAKALGMEVRVGGRLGIGLLPGLHVTLEDVHIRNRGAEVGAANQARLGIDLFPLLRGQVRIGTIALKHATLIIERGRDGKFNVERPEAAAGALPAVALATVSLSDGTLRYTDRLSGDEFEAAACRLEVRRLRLAGRGSPELMKNLSFTAELACGEVRRNDFTVSDLEFSVAGKNGVFDVEPVAMRALGGQGSGNIRADFTGAVPIYHIRYALAQFRIEEFFKTLSPQKVAEGSMDFSANLSMQGTTLNEMRQTLYGQFSLRGENLTLSGHDLDREFSRFESSQNFNLVDVGAFFLAGPVGVAVTKGYNFASILQGAGGRSEIRLLVSDWKVERGVAQAQDVAMATNENRVALQGGLDFVNQQFNHVTVAVIDPRGCAMVRQKISGRFRKPVVEPPNILMSLTGPARELLKKGRDLFSGGECEVFYAGSVAPPK